MLDRHPWITQMPVAAPPVAPNSMGRGDHPGRRPGAHRAGRL